MDHASTSEPLRYILFLRVVDLCGIQVAEEGIKRIKDKRTRAPLDLLDIVELRDKVKHMDVVSRTKGIFFQLKAAKEPDSANAKSLLLRSISHLKSALSCMPTNKESLLQCAISWFRYLEVCNEPTDRKYEVDPRPIRFDLSDPQVLEAEQLFRRALVEDGRNVLLLCVAGKFFGACHKFDIAEECFLRAVEEDDSSFFARACYGVFLFFNGYEDLGIKFLERCPNSSFPSSINYLLTSEWKVKVPLYFEDGSLYPHPLVFPFNTPAKDLVSLLIGYLGFVSIFDCSLMEIILPKEKLMPEKVRFQTLVANKENHIRELGKEELPWLSARKKGAMLYFVMKYTEVEEK
jgi:hypothetical protein